MGCTHSPCEFQKQPDQNLLLWNPCFMSTYVYINVIFWDCLEEMRETFFEGITSIQEHFPSKMCKHFTAKFWRRFRFCTFGVRKRQIQIRTFAGLGFQLKKSHLDEELVVSLPEGCVFNLIPWSVGNMATDSNERAGSLNRKTPRVQTTPRSHSWMYHRSTFQVMIQQFTQKKKGLWKVKRRLPLSRLQASNL